MGTTKNDPTEAARAPRLELYAVVAIKSGKRRVILSVRNLSESGVLLDADEDERGKLPVDSVHDISVFDRDHAEHRAVTAKATVVRHEDRGIALTWKSDEVAMKKIARLIETLRPRGS